MLKNFCFGVRQFILMSCLDNKNDFQLFLGIMVNKDYIYCFGLCFVNKFLIFFDCSVVYGVEFCFKDFYCWLSLEFYGVEFYYD